MSGQEEIIVTFLKQLPEQTPTTVRFFVRGGGDYYSVHGKDALFIAKDFYHTMAVVKYFDISSNAGNFNSSNNQSPYVNVSSLMYESTIRDLLLNRQYCVEVYSKDGMKPWMLSKKGSPGSLQAFEDELFSNAGLSDSPIIMAVGMSTVGHIKKVGVAYCDTSVNTFGLCEFVDNDQFSNLEAIHVQLCAKECLVYTEANNPDSSRLVKNLTKTSMMVTTRRKADFNVKDIEQDLSRLVKDETPISSLPEFELKIALGALASIIRYMELLSEDSNFGQFSLKTFDLTQYMRLDAAAARALNLSPNPLDGSHKNMCISGLLNKCKTSQGQRLLNRFVKQPLMDVNKIQERQNLVEIFVEDSALRQSIREDHLKNVPDMSRIIKKFLKKHANLNDCVRVYSVIHKLPALIEGLEYCESPYKQLFDQTFTNKFKEVNGDFAKYLELIETTIEFNEDEHEAYIKPSYDQNLENIRNQMNDLTKQMNNQLNKVTKELNQSSVKLEKTPNLGYHFRLTLKDEKSIRGKSKYQTLETQKSGVRFTNTELTRLNESYKNFWADYNETQQKISSEVIGIASGYCEPMEMFNEIVSLLDVLTSFAQTAVDAPIQYTRPKIYARGSTHGINLKASRHPCLEMQEEVRFISNDIVLNREDQSFIIITGPNMGGKSTYIRQLGCIVLMAQIGSFVPCSEGSFVTVVDSILARVGAGDSQLKGISTFMAEMLETASILKSATKDSLIIIDELGRGTSTYDGFGLAWALSEYIAKDPTDAINDEDSSVGVGVGAYCAFATHFHELTSLANVNPKVKNFHVSALTEDSRLTLLYKVEPGFCDQSFGIHVAELANFPQEVVTVAKIKAKELEDFSINSFKDVADEGKNEDKDKADEVIGEFFREIAKRKISDMTSDEAIFELKKLKTQMIDTKLENSRYLKSLVDKASNITIQA